MNKPGYLRLSVLESSKILIYEFWYDYVKPKYGEKVKLCYMDIDSSIRRYSERHCRRCWNKTWYFKLWIRETVTKSKKMKN